MSSSNEEFPDTDSDDEFNEDMEALRRACQLTGKTPIDHRLQLSSTTAAAATVGGVARGGALSEAESDKEGDDDLQLVRSIQRRFASSMDVEEEPLKMKPLCMLPPEFSDSDDCEDDYETLRAIQRRFAAYTDGGFKDNVEDFLHRPVQVGANIIDSEKETSNSFVERTNAREGFLNCVDTSEATGKKLEACNDAGGRQPSDLVEWNGPGADDVAGLPLKTSDFPKSALAFVDAIKKNRSCQKLIRSKMMQMEARIEELNKLIDRVKLLKDFQVACKKRTGRALSQKKDPRVQLISLPKLRANMRFNEKKVPALYRGPPENFQVANYKEALATYAVPVTREKWSKEERENLVKGVKQQFQEMLLQRSVDLLSEADGSYDSSNVDSIIESIKDIDITPEKLRSFLPKVNWEQLAAMYVPGRSGAECQSRFLNFEDPLINHEPWTTVEDKNLLHVIQQKGLSDWIDIAASLGTNRTPFQCLARYQRSLNASILKREWTREEDNQLRAAVEACGESNWQAVASMMEGRTGTQCSNRWLKTLHPARKRVGRWTADEDKRLKVAVTLFGPKTWKKVACCVPGRTQVQCRERWVNCLDPSLNMAEWTEEEDLKLEAAVAEHGYCWSKVAACMPRRTDNQCLRRWKALFPTEVPLLQAARKIQKAALISNFVDRESERPALGPNDFRLPETYFITGSESVDPPMRKKRRSRWRKAHEYNEENAHSGETSSEVLRLTNGSELENNLQHRSVHRKGKGRSSRSMKSSAGPSADNHLSACPDSLLETSNGEKIRKSCANDGNSKRKFQSKKKKSRVKSEFSDATATTTAVIAIEPHSKEYEHPDPIECLPTPPYPNLHEVSVGAELGGDNVTKSRKASKLHPRRRRGKILEEVPEALSKVDTLPVMKRRIKKKTKQADAPNDHRSSFGDSMSLMDTSEAAEAAPVIKARKRKRKMQETCSSNDCMRLAVVDQSVNMTPTNMEKKKAVHKERSVKLLRDKSSCQLENQHFRSYTDDAVSGNSGYSSPSDGDSDLKHRENAIGLSETEEESMTLASFLRQRRADRTRSPSETFGGFQRKIKKCSQVHIGSSSADVSIPNQPKRQRTRDETCLSQTAGVGTGSRNDNKGGRDRASEIEAGDDSHDTTVGAGSRNDNKAHRNRESEVEAGDDTTVGAGSRNNNKAHRNQALEVEAGDDTTLAHFYNKKLKQRRTGAP